MSEATLPAAPNLPSFAARFINDAAEKGLTTVAASLATAGVLSGANESALVQIGAGAVLWVASWVVGYVKARVAHGRMIALANAPAANPPLKV